MSVSYIIIKQKFLSCFFFQSAPEHASRSQRREFQTDLLKGLMDHLLAADALLGEQAALPLATGGSYANTAANVFYFANRVVDKLWQGNSYFHFEESVFIVRIFSHLQLLRVF